MRLPIVLQSPVRWWILVLAAALFFSAGLNVQAEVNPQEQEIFNLLKNDPGQHRPSVTLDPVLCEVARARAADMADRGYFDHTDPSGHGPNWWVEQAGYELPATYDHSADGNNIESASAGRSTPDATWDDWMTSPHHKQHLLGEDPFYASQTAIGVGFVRRSGSDYTYYWVVLSAPVSGPQLSIRTPAGGSEIDQTSVTVSGTTSGNPAAASVQVRVENASGTGAWTSATGIASWSASVSGLAAGVNTIRVRSLNSAGAVLKEAARNVRRIVMAPLSVQMNGEGSITEEFSGTTMREVGESYRVTARPAPGWVFAGWSGSLTATNATASFVMTEGMSLTANFSPNPFVNGTGRYTALFSTGAAQGIMRLNVSSSGTFTGKVKFGQVSIALSGRFSSTGDAKVDVTGSDGKSYSAELQYDASSARVTGTLSGSGWSTAVDADHLFAQADGTNPHAGRFTIAVSSPSVAGAPQGEGIATVSVGSNGVVTGNGTLADGTPFALKGPLTTGGELPVYASLYQGRGVLAGSLSFRTTSVSDLDGTLFWSRPASAADAAFPGGFAVNTVVVGSQYTQPAAGQPVVPVPAAADNATLVLGDGGIAAPIDQDATLNADNSVVISAPELDRLSCE